MVAGLPCQIDLIASAAVAVSSDMWILPKTMEFMG
jgi:hypothetical protein